MKKFILVLLFCMVSSLAFAVTAEIKSITRDDNRNLFWVVIEYTMADGEEIENAYPVNTYKMMDKTSAQIQQWLIKNVKHQCDNYIAREFFERNTALQTILEGFIGNSMAKDEARIEYDFDDDGTVDKAFEIKEDGTYEEVTP